MEKITLDYKDIGERIRNAREKKRLSQQTLAEHSFLQPNSISHIENGSTNVSLISLVYISRALDTPIDYFLCGVAPVSKEAVNNIFDNLLADCSREEVVTLLSICSSAKEAIRKNIIRVTGQSD